MKMRSFYAVTALALTLGLSSAALAQNAQSGMGNDQMQSGMKSSNMGEDTTMSTSKMKKHSKARKHAKSSKSMKSQPM